MAGRADELTREVEPEPQPAITQVEIERGRLLFVDALVAPPPDRARERLDQILGQAKRFTDIADGALRAIADDRRAERSMGATIGVEHPLHDDLAPRMLEIDVDVGRLLALLTDEPLEKDRKTVV